MPPMIPAPGAFLAGIAIFLIVIWDAFESIILPRRVASAPVIVPSPEGRRPV